MSDIHIDDFYKDVAVSFLHLYNSFPRKIILYTEDICGSDEPDEFGLHSVRFLSAFSAIVWLGEQGYLQYDATIKQEGLDQVTLTEKGLLLLSSRSDLDFGDPLIQHRDGHVDDSTSLPSSILEQSKTNISQLRKAVKSGSSIMIGQCVRHMLSTAYERA
ncbi:hypothetical protein [Oceanicoccus sp. KOV_DT_Chl]|uniref:hypothetical protein n=1 Tax=Oceanicoccus sp. KOV_DT_Chl TaxID=1904639 RepID=UPI000C7B8442|nr:hypothetical protein [Oceanicoccus sp. KOV_DT_Chl]